MYRKVSYNCGQIPKLKFKPWLDSKQELCSFFSPFFSLLFSSVVSQKFIGTKIYSTDFVVALCLCKDVLKMDEKTLFRLLHIRGPILGLIFITLIMILQVNQYLWSWCELFRIIKRHGLKIHPKGLGVLPKYGS